jgi:hypothetical protein
VGQKCFVVVGQSDDERILGLVRVMLQIFIRVRGYRTNHELTPQFHFKNQCFLTTANPDSDCFRHRPRGYSRRRNNQMFSRLWKKVKPLAQAAFIKERRANSEGAEGVADKHKS